ncbi:MAG: ABC transporter ATP-binding protein [Anaerolineae bacterium]|nr:ABC transporter ATP-binding protein [Anaerolineae bacterium]
MAVSTASTTWQPGAAEFVARTFERSDYTNATRFIWSHIRRHPTFALVMVLGSLVNAALASAVPIFMGLAFDHVLGGGGLEYVGWMGLAIIATQLARGVFQFMRNFSSEIFAQRIERDLRDEIYVSLLSKSMTFHDMHPSGEIMARVTNDVREVNFMMNPGLNLIIGSGMFLVMPIFASFAIHPALALTPFGFLLGYVIAQIYYVRSLRTVAQDVRRNFGIMNAQLAETLDGIEVIKGTAQEKKSEQRFHDLVDQVRNAFVRQGDIEANYWALLLLGIATVTGFAHAALLYRQDIIAAGAIVNYMGQIALFGFPVFTSIFAYARLATGHAGAKRILSIIKTETELDQNEAGHNQTMRGEIRFENVHFGYATGKEVLHGISFTIQPGQTVAVVGQTGSGKTTLTKLINRIYDANQGRVLIDGVDVRDWNLACLRSQISVIEQEIFLFSRTIAENIRFGRRDATQAEIETAAADAQAHEFITRFPEGYETVIGQRGVTLSGGQRQRLAIARAFLTDPRILVLDDSTSAIDSATEDQIQKAIWKAAAGRTTLLITHRLSQIRWADLILVMRNGRIVAQGDHDTLLQTSEAYRRIFAQFEDEGEPAHVHGA